MGLFDVAEGMGIPGRNEDFGQTLAVWGVGEGGYFVIPGLGPSSMRDVTGLVVDVFLDPLFYFAPTAALVSRTAVRGIDEREQVLEALDEIQTSSLDYYAALRSLYRQSREDQIRDGAAPPTLNLPAIAGDDYEGDELQESEFIETEEREERERSFDEKTTSQDP